MLKDFLQLKGIKSQAKFPEVGYGQVEPNHLSARHTAQIYAQLPADKDITILENGQYVKYDYAAGLVNFTGAGEWMLVFNEIKLYREGQLDCEFAMIKENYGARVYSPLDADKPETEYGPTRFWNNNNPAPIGFDPETGKPTTDGTGVADYGVVSNVEDIYEMNYTTDPWHRLRDSGKREKMMPEGTSMVPRVFKTNVGDHYTTNMINEDSVAVGDLLYVGEKGILAKTKVEASDTFAGSGDMTWQVVKVYTMPDHTRGAKVMRIQ